MGGLSTEREDKFVFYFECIDFVVRRLCTQQVINFFSLPKTCSIVLKFSEQCERKVMLETGPYPKLCLGTPVLRKYLIRLYK